MTKIPKMTQQHFVFIADVINAMPTHSVGLRNAKATAIRNWADALARTNPQFQRETFLKACGGDPETLYLREMSKLLADLDA